MNDKLQRAATARKVAYLGAIVLLFAVCMVWRGILPLPVGDPAKGYPTAAADGTLVPPALNDKLARLPVRYQAEDLELRELDLGDPEVSGSVAQFSLLGFRGAVTTVFWNGVIENQKRGEFDAMRRCAKVVSALQPHFVEPWIFQAWNFTYNVSVENEKLGDMYYYIADGIAHLAEGDRVNTRVYRGGGAAVKVGSPDIRYQLAFYYQNKFSVSDKVATLRSLMQVSCIRPADRDPRRLRPDDAGPVDAERFEAFCRANPQLVRRLRTKLNCKTPAQVVDFLAVNADVPTRYQPGGGLKGADEQFPVLPPRFESDSEVAEVTPQSDTTDAFDAFLAARGWFQYAQTTVPPPVKGEPAATPQPGRGEFDEYRYRIPQRPVLIVFRNAPARAQEYLADRLTQEGWFATGTEWDPDERTDPRGRWFPGRAVRLTAADAAQREWQASYALWRRFGEDNGLILSASTLKTLRDRAARTTRLGGSPDSPPPFEPTAEQLAAIGATADDYRARKQLVYYSANQTVCNFDSHLRTAEAERGDDAARARAGLWQAEGVRGRTAEAVPLYAEGNALWRLVLAKNREYHQGEKAELVHEATLKYEGELADLLVKSDAVQGRLAAARDALRGVLSAAPLPDAAEREVERAIAEDEAEARIAERLLPLLGTPLPADPAARRAAVDGDYAWAKRWTTPDRTFPWVRADVRGQEAMSRRPPPAPPSAPIPRGEPGKADK